MASSCRRRRTSRTCCEGSSKARVLEPSTARQRARCGPSGSCVGAENTSHGFVGRRFALDEHVNGEDRSHLPTRLRRPHVGDPRHDVDLSRLVFRPVENSVVCVPFRDEIAESCPASLSQVKEFTDDTLARLSHPTAQAALGAILDVVRSFLDTWEGTRTPHEPFERRPDHLHSHREADFALFLQDFGALREKMRVLVGMLELLEPKATAPRLLEDSVRTLGAE